MEQPRSDAHADFFDAVGGEEMLGMSFESHVDIVASPTNSASAPKDGTVPADDAVDIDEGLDYARHPILLWFRDAAVEQRFCDFIFIESGFIGGKLYAGVALAVMVISYFLFPKGGPNVGVLSDPWWVPMHVNVVVNAALLGCMFIQRLHKYREVMFLIILGTHWPAFATMVMFGKAPHSHTYAYFTGCFFFCAFVTQCRFARVAPFLTVTPIATLLLTTFVLSDYYGTHSHLGMLWWFLVVFPNCLLMLFERKSRQAFVDMEVAHAAADASERKTQLTRNTITSFFSATATRDLLLRHGPRNKLYPNTVLVMSDIAMFAAFLSRTPTAEVVQILSEFFLAIDDVARNHCVEKIATVGDAYFGAVFASDAETALVGDAAPTPSFLTRCSHGVSFACRIVRFARGLRVRTGVHVGDVTGGFVGCKPPKFDLFGAAVDHVKVMEESSHNGAAHVSRRIVDACAGSSGPLGLHATTEHGVVCHAWAHDPSLSEELGTYANQRAPAPNTIVAVLCELGEDPEFMAHAATDEVDPRTGQATPQPHTSEGSHLVDDVTADLELHPLLLSFKRSSVEARYCWTIRRSDINSVACKFWIVMELTLVLAHVSMGCLQSRQDRYAVAAIIGIISVMVGYVSWIGTEHRFNTPVVAVGFFSIFVVAVLVIRSDCTDGLPRQEFYTDNIVMLYFMMAMMVPQFCLDVKLVIRVAILVSFGIVGAALQVVRRELLHPTAAAWDTGAIPIMCVAFGAMSYFADYSLRRSFAAVVHLKRLQVAARGRYTAMSGKAMGIMLPQFVIDRISRAATASAAAPHERVLPDRSAPTAVAPVTSPFEFTNAHPVWDFASVGVLMIHFTVAHSLPDSFTTIRRVINHVEAVIANHGVFKLKTVGTTIMCLLGIDDSLMPEMCALNLVIAARAVRAQVLKPLTDSLHDDATFRISIHGGPCFGAVMGDDSFTFDVFGETINNAVALLPHAPKRCIQISDSMQLLIPHDVAAQHRFTVAPSPGVTLVKSGAQFDVFAIGDAMTAAMVMHA
jgi:class 3 adenylate cyclase